MKTLFGGIKTTALVVSAFLNGALCTVIAVETALIYVKAKEEDAKKNKHRSFDDFARAYRKEHGYDTE